MNRRKFLKLMAWAPFVPVLGQVLPEPVMSGGKEIRIPLNYGPLENEMWFLKTQDIYFKDAPLFEWMKKNAD